MAISLISLLTGRPTRPRLSMTGEITLRGRVLPVGGLKEKVLAAHRAGINTIIIPAKNQKDLEDIPPEIRKRVRFIPVETIDDAVAAAFAKDGSKNGKKTRGKTRKRARK